MKVGVDELEEDWWVSKECRVLTFACLAVRVFSFVQGFCESRWRRPDSRRLRCQRSTVMASYGLCSVEISCWRPSAATCCAVRMGCFFVQFVQREDQADKKRVKRSTLHMRPGASGAAEAASVRRRLIDRGRAVRARRPSGAGLRREWSGNR